MFINLTTLAPGCICLQAGTLPRGHLQEYFYEKQILEDFSGDKGWALEPQKA
jgi:hypothetical protein